MKLWPICAAATALVFAVPVAAQEQEKPSPVVQAERAKHLVMFTRNGPNWDKRNDYRADFVPHQQLYLRLTASGHIVAGGAFEGEPVLGVSIFRQCIDEATARELLKDDPLWETGVVAFEFRTLALQMGSLEGGQTVSK